MMTTREMRRSDILKAARLEFCEKGLEGASVSEIAKRAGIGKSTVYEYFLSKDELLEAVCVQVGEMLESELQKAFSEEKTLRGRIVRYYDVVEKVISELGIGPDILFTNAPIRHVVYDYAKTIRGRIIERVSEAVREGQKNGEASTEFDAGFLAALLTSQAIPLFKETDGENAAYKAIDVLMRGIRP